MYDIPLKTNRRGSTTSGLDTLLVVFAGLTAGFAVTFMGLALGVALLLAGYYCA